MSLSEKVKTLLEATLEETVQKIARDLFKERYGKSLECLMNDSNARWKTHQVIEENVIAVTKEILQTDEEIRTLVKSELTEALRELFAPKQGLAENSNNG